MDTTNAIVVADRDALDTLRDDTSTFDVFVAMQKRGEARRLDAELVHLVTDRAGEFAGLSPREQAAVAWVEAVISSGKTQSSDGAYAALHKHFDDAAIAKLTALAGTASARAKLGGSKHG
jgi:alkylhydroperoxidase family enzyme